MSKCPQYMLTVSTSCITTEMERQLHTQEYVSIIPKSDCGCCMRRSLTLTFVGMLHVDKAAALIVA